MVITLIKKELRDSKNIFAPIIMAVGVLFIATSLQEWNLKRNTNIINNYGLFSIIELTILLIILSIVILSIIAVIKYLYKNIYNSKGYELFTLPANSHELLIAKLITVLIWTILITLTVIFTVIIMQSRSNEHQFTFEDYLFIKFFSKDNILEFIKLGLFNIVLMSNLVITILFAGALVHTKYIQKFRPAIAFITVIIITVISYSIQISLTGYYSSLLDSGLTMLLAGPTYLNSIRYDNIIYLIIFFVIIYSFTAYLWTNKLELSDN